MRRRLAVEMIVVYLAWCAANLGANLIQASPGRAQTGAVAYYVGVAATGVLIPWALARRHGFDLRWWPRAAAAPRAVLAGGLLLAAMVFMGVMALADQGLSRDHLLTAPPGSTLQPLAYLSLSMVAYLVLFWTYLRQGAQRLARPAGTGDGGRSAAARVLGTVVPAAAYGIYHVTSVDSLSTLGALTDEIVITTVIGLLLGAYLQVTPNLVLVWVALNTINLFAFAADPQFHAGWGGGLVAVAFLAVTLAGLLLHTRRHRRTPRRSHPRRSRRPAPARDDSPGRPTRAPALAAAPRLAGPPEPRTSGRG